MTESETERRRHERAVAALRVEAVVQQVRRVAEDIGRLQPDWALVAEASSPRQRAEWLKELNEARRVFDRSTATLIELACGDLTDLRRCTWCGTAMLGGRRDRKFCSDACRRKAFPHERVHAAPLVVEAERAGAS